jgi:hypothetical protein
VPTSTAGQHLYGGRELKLLQALLATVPWIDIEDDEVTHASCRDADVIVRPSEPGADLLLAGRGVLETVRNEQADGVFPRVSASLVTTRAAAIANGVDREDWPATRRVA